MYIYSLKMMIYQYYLVSCYLECYQTFIVSLILLFTSSRLIVFFTFSILEKHYIYILYYLYND